MPEEIISHAFVLPDDNFDAWFQAVRPYTSKFPRVALVRSPRGNDLNRYRNVSAVAAPQTWIQDDPAAHIRRIYPQVVRVDVIYATRPEQMSAILQERINTNDRYGEKQTSRPHIFERFVLDWATDYRPLRILRRFSDAPGIDQDNEGIDIFTAPGSKILAAAAGTVAKIYTGATDDALKLGRYVQVTTVFNQIQYIITYAQLRKVTVTPGKVVKVGDALGEASGASIKLIVQQINGGMSGFRLPNIVNPTDMIYVQNLRVRPTDSGLRVRTLASTEGQVIGQVNPWDALESMEMHGRALGKIGVNGDWLKVKLPDGREGFTAAWFLEATIKGNYFDGINPVGVNLDSFHPLGSPPANRLGQIGWVRIGYNVSAFTGSEDIQAAYNRYAPLADRYAKAGYKVMFVTSHQTYGEGKQEFWPWTSMDDAKWNTLTDRFADMMGRIARQYAGKGLVHAWQIWNEQDAGPNAIASIPVPAHQYGNMLTKSIRAIRATEREAFLITGGQIAGPEPGAAYARQTLKVMPADIRPDGLAVHPYGRGPQPGEPYAIFGHVDDLLQTFMKVMPGMPVWITEWGVLDRSGDNPAAIANYALSFINYIKTRYGDKVASMIWYAWAHGMHNGYGIVDGNLNPRSPLTEKFLQA